MSVPRPAVIATVFLLCLLDALTTLMAKDRQLVTVSNEMREAAIDFLATLDDQLREQIKFAFDGDERTNWHYIPKQRPGVSFKEMNLEQRRAARVLLRTALSEKGYLKAMAIMSLEQVLRTLEADRENVEEIRDAEKYWFTVFGDPAADKHWGWRVEGHHLSLNFTTVDGVVASAAPIFMGSNPAEIRSGPRTGLRVLGSEVDLARKLMATFTAEQRSQVTIDSEPPSDVLTVPGQPIDKAAADGLKATEMTKRQRGLLKQMLYSFLRHLRAKLAAEEIKQVEKAGVENLSFAWAGSLKRGEGHYFRIYGPTFVLEYDNAQGNHAHLVWHSRDNDFGSSVLRHHYETSPHHQEAVHATP